MSHMALWGEGQVFGIPVSVHTLLEDGKLRFVGRGHFDSANLKSLLEQWGIYEKLRPVVHMLGPVNADATVRYQAGEYAFALRTPATAILFSRSGGGAAFLFTFSRASLAGQGGELVSMLHGVVEFLGVHSLYFYCRTGSGADIRSLSAGLPARYLETPAPSGQVGEAILPANLSRADLVFHGVLELSGNVFYQALHELLGISFLDFYFYKGGGSYCGMLTIPRIRTEMFSVDELHISVGTSGSAGFFLRLEGTVGFPPLGDGLKFLVGCSAGKGSFSLTAGMTSKEPVSIINDSYKLRELMLFIGYSPGGPQFGFVGSLSLNRLELFAALVYSHPGRLSLLSAAISDVTFSGFLAGVTSVDFGDGLAAMDSVLAIRAFDLCGKAPFSPAEKARYEGFVLTPAEQRFEPDSAEANAPYLSARRELTAYFHSKLSQGGVVDKTGLFAFSDEDVELRYLSGGNVGLVDKTKMRHYLIRVDGSIALQAQFFYALEDISIGSYHVSKGIFACATVAVFGVTIKALFSLDEQTGCVAFAYVSEIDMGFLAISKSSFAPEADDKGKLSLPLPEDSIVYSFLEKNMDGAIFFMEAGPQSVSFYFDGKITLYRAITFDARVLCAAGEVSIRARFTLWNFLQLSLDLAVCYHDFENASFLFYFSLDFSLLEESINRFKQKIERQIQELRGRIDNKKHEVNRARGALQGMRDEITGIDGRLQHLKRNWRSRLCNCFEIGWLECKRIGIQAAVWVAERALDVAVAALELAGGIGEGVLRFVNNVIDFAMNLFFLRKVELRAAAGAAGQEFGVHVEGILLGNEFTIDSTVSLNLLEMGKERILAFFTELFTTKLDTDITQAGQSARKQAISGGDGQQKSLPGQVAPKGEGAAGSEPPGKKRPKQRRQAHGAFDSPEQLENLESHQLLESVRNISGLLGDNAGFYGEMTGLLDDPSLSPTALQEAEVELLGLTASAGVDDMIYTLGILDDAPALPPELTDPAGPLPEGLGAAVAEFRKAQELAEESRRQVEALRRQREELLAGVRAAPRKSYATQSRRMQVMRPAPAEQSRRFAAATDSAVRKSYRQGPRASFIHLPYETGVVQRNQVYHPRLAEEKPEQ